MFATVHTAARRIITGSHSLMILRLKMNADGSLLMKTLDRSVETFGLEL